MVTSALKTLWQQVYASPSSDAPRQKLAAVLTRMGDPRGEFISLQLRGSDDATGSQRAEALLRRHRDAWLGPLLPYLPRKTKVVFRRGLPAEAEVLVRKMSPAIAALDEWATLERLSFAPSSATFVAPQMRALTHIGPLNHEAAGMLIRARAPWAIESLELGLHGSYVLDPGDLAVVGQGNLLPALRTLCLNDRNDCTWVWHAPFATTLESFTWNQPTNPRVLRELHHLALSRTPQLRELSIRPPLWGEEQALPYLFTSGETSGTRLTQLRVEGFEKRFHDGLIRSLLALPPDSLTRLEVTCDEPWATSTDLDELQDLARRFPRLRELDINGLAKPRAVASKPRRTVPSWVQSSAPPPLDHLGDHVNAACFAPDSSRLFFACGAQVIVVSLSEKGVLARIGARSWYELCTEGVLEQLALSPDGQHLVMSDTKMRRILRLPLDGTATTQTRSRFSPWHLALQGDGRRVAGWGVGSKTIDLFELPSLAHVTSFEAPSPVVAAVFAPDHDTLYVATIKGVIHRWSCAREAFTRGFALRLPLDHNSSGLEVSPDGRWLVAFASDSGVRLWSTDQRTTLDLANRKDKEDWSQTAVFGGPEPVVYWGCAAGLFARRLDDGSERRLLGPLPSGSRLLAASPDGRWLALNTSRGLRLHDTQTGALAWSSDRATQATAR